MYCLYGADVHFTISEPYGIAKDSIKLPDDPTRAHIRIFEHKDKSLFVHVDIEGISVVQFAFPKIIRRGEAYEFKATTSLPTDELINVLTHNHELVNRLRNAAASLEKRKIVYPTDNK